MLKQVIKNNLTPTANYNNCSGKHTAMLAHAKMRGLPLDTYLSNDHPVQRDILTGFAEMCGLRSEAVGKSACAEPTGNCRQCPVARSTAMKYRSAPGATPTVLPAASEATAAECIWAGCW